MYRAYGLLLANSDFDLATAAQRLTDKFPGFHIARDDQRVTVSKDDWEIHLTMRQGPDVLEESRQIAEHIGGAEEDEIGITTCDRRVEVESDVPDNEMEHFDDYLKVIEVLRTFRGLVGVDPEEPSLL